MIPPTISQLDRLEACPPSASFRAVRIVEPPEALRERGTDIHRFLDLVAHRGRDAALEAMADSPHLETLEALDLDDLPHVSELGATEVAMALDVEAGTARELQTKERAYRVSARELPGTTDWAQLVDDGKRAVVLDVKTGWATLPRPRDSLQLLGYALGLSAIWGVDSVTVGFLKGPDASNRFRLVSETLDVFDLDEGWERLRGLFARVAQGPTAGPLTVGSHCRYCPAALVCPAQTALVAGVPQVAEAMKGGAVDPATLPAAYDYLKAAERALKAARERLDDLARQSPLRWDDGRVYGEVEAPEERLDAEKGRPILEALGLAAAVENEPKLTKASLGRAVRVVAAARGEKMAPITRDALEALRAGGAASTTTHLEMRLMTPARGRSTP